MHKIREPLEVKPFLDWAARREQVLEVQYSDRAEDGKGGLHRLLEEIGWSDPSGHKRMYRWRHELRRGIVERATVEDALHHAGYLFSDVYPDVELPSSSTDRRYTPQRLMTDDQVVAAHTVYVKAKLTMLEVANLLWEKYGYVSPTACRKALSVAFRALALPSRRCTATARSGEVCGGPPGSGLDVCLMHAEEGAAVMAFEMQRRGGSEGRWPVPEYVVAEARTMREEWGMPFTKIAACFIDDPGVLHTRADALARRLSRELERAPSAAVYAFMPSTSAWERAA
jgi:hypothetical protein